MRQSPSFLMMTLPALLAAATAHAQPCEAAAGHPTVSHRPAGEVGAEHLGRLLAPQWHSLKRERHSLKDPEKEAIIHLESMGCGNETQT